MFSEPACSRYQSIVCSVPTTVVVTSVQLLLYKNESIMLYLRADLALLLWGCKVKILVLIYQTCESLLNNQPPSKFYIPREKPTSLDWGSSALTQRLHPETPMSLL